MARSSDLVRSIQRHTKQDQFFYPSRAIIKKILLIKFFVVLMALCPFSSIAQANYVQTNIVSDGSVSDAKVDASLIDPWGIAIGKAFWVDSPGSGLALVDDSQGNQQINVVIPPASLTGSHGMPIGVVFNSDATVFQIPGNTAVQFIVGTLDGTIAAWTSSTPQAVTVVNNSVARAVYTAIAIDTNADGTFLLAPNQIPGGSIDVFDKSF